MGLKVPPFEQPKSEQENLKVMLFWLLFFWISVCHITPRESRGGANRPSDERGY